eukprot:Skav236066  [mRNA]  locus=scaffold2211:36982:38621:- [translate_table: standard]
MHEPRGRPPWLTNVRSSVRSFWKRRTEELRRMWSTSRPDRQRRGACSAAWGGDDEPQMAGWWLGSDSEPGVVLYPSEGAKKQDMVGEVSSPIGSEW